MSGGIAVGCRPFSPGDRNHMPARTLWRTLSFAQLFQIFLGFVVDTVPAVTIMLVMATTIYIRPDDHERLVRLAKLETRSTVDQLTVMLDEAFAKRGLTPEPGATTDATAETAATK